MHLKKVVTLALAGVMAVGLVGCGNGGAGKTSKKEASSSDDSKIVVWTLAEDLNTFAKQYMKENEGKKVEVVVIKPADYPTKIATALDGGEKEPDIIVAEPQMLGNFYDAGYFADLDELGAKEYEGKIVDYVWQAGKSEDGVQRAISYQITPAGFYYRRDIAEKVFGTSNPDEIGKLFKDYDTILETGKTLKKAGYKLFSSDGETNYFSGNEAWVVDGKLNVAQCRYDYMDMCVKLWQNEYTAFASQWSTPWYQAMKGPVAVLTADTQNGVSEEGDVWDEEKFNEATKDLPKSEVFAFGLPAWGVLTIRDNVEETTAGKWGVCSGPSYGFGGGTYIGISALSKNKEAAWDFVKYCTLTESTMEWWIEESEGDTVSYLPTLEKHKDDTNPVYGDQQLYKFWLEQAEGIDYSKVTKYDQFIGDEWGKAISKIKKGEADKETAINEFYDAVAATYPNIVIER